MLIHTTHVTPHLITHQINSQLNLFFFPLNPIYIQNYITFLPIYLLNEGDRTSEPADQGLQLLNWAESEPRSSHLYSQEITAELWLFEGFIGLHVISDSRVPHQKHCLPAWYADVSQSTVMTITRVHSKQSLVFGDEFKVTPEVFSWDQTSQVLPHWLNHHFSLILVLYTETLSC